MDADIAPVLGQGADGVRDKHPQGLTGKWCSLADPMQPGAGHARGGKKGQGRQLHEGCCSSVRVLLAAGAVLLGQYVQRRFVGFAQGRVHQIGVIIAGQAGDDLVKRVLAQFGQVLV